MTQSPFPFDLVGFDLDGTLLDTSDELTVSLNHALAEAGRPPLSQGEVRPMVGLGAKHMLRMGLAASGDSDEAAVDALLPVLIDHYDANLGSGSPPFPGLLDAMDGLAAAGARFAVVTNKYERLAVKLIAAKGLAHRFETVIGGNTLPGGQRKPDRAPIDEMIRRSGSARAAFVGDSIYDVQAAQSAGIPAVAVRFGFLTQPVEELGADAIIDHYDALTSVLEGMG
ncbi:HAD-IA family hydrolase [Parasphingopyxis algicola]|uniref:HAD-IA family hydrolase n=1 Tax=Parasphingopyxis algicola TaxID=2026624 RepID=UPI0015A1B758|nr:HAD-IA family hydrolase [Parasphingopyxis algicola]QLC24637.1 HAD-IA family hydrolase [Parasphingopyxis algicola]